MKIQTLALSLSIVIALIVVDAAVAGVWTPIKNLKDKNVKEIAEFAVTEHDNQVKSNLKLDSILKGESQHLDGTDYRLVLAVKEGGADNKYEAVVFENVDKLKALVSFVPSNG